MWSGARRVGTAKEGTTEAITAKKRDSVYIVQRKQMRGKWRSVEKSGPLRNVAISWGTYRASAKSDVRQKRKEDWEAFEVD